MFLCETFIDCNVADDEISIQDYSVVLIYVKNGIKYTNITNFDTHVEKFLLTLSIITTPSRLV